MVVQLRGSSRALWLIGLPIATLGCATGASGVATDAAPQQTDAPVGDVAHVDAAADADPACAISNGATPSLDGNNDIAKYAVTQQLTPGAMLGSDTAALAWNRTHLFVTVSSSAFAAAFEPLHVYVQTGAALGPAVAANGKEYSALTPAVPFTPTHAIAVRRTSDSGTGGGYNGVYAPTDQWQTRTLALETDTFASNSQMSVRVPWTAIGGCPSQMRLVLHVVHGAVANEWKDLVPSTHTPWLMPGGGFYEIDLTAAPVVSTWSLR